MRLKERITNTKRHTIGFTNASNQRLTRADVVHFARQGKVEGVQVRRIGRKYYPQSVRGATRLYDLPERVSTEPISSVVRASQKTQ